MNRDPDQRPLLSRAAGIFKPLEQFFRVETAGGLVLIFAAVLALLWANGPFGESYGSFWETKLFAAGPSLHFLINEGLMTIFFLVVGLEIRREIHDGALSNLRVAMLPLLAALGGIIAPALIYLAFNMDGFAIRGWAVPTATDIAFAVGAFALLGKHVNPALRVLLLALAIADDIAAVLIIAFFYADGLAVAKLGIAAAGVIGVLLLNRYRIRFAALYIVGGALVWYGLLHAGLHPALAGVVLGLLMPVSASPEGQEKKNMPLAIRLEAALHPWVAFGIMPLFALANAGVNIGGLDLEGAGTLTLTVGIILGLAVGKPLGILSATALAVRMRLCALPPGVTWSGITLIGCLGGIGFTMSIFIATLAFPDAQQLAAAKLGVLLASLLAGSVGLAMSRICFGNETHGG